ncbi:LysR family transcriptional regulator [Paucibacter sp. M5-1]|uniref:LysR family transcriptional regulator n=1 Tax=Paucibacter sp. M5-1 TaxID=3015998 RepID=UPI0022B91A33|nr:LysR family transcriptional regulator [Paucibacter sp. M5-1]MCZ7880499.1 LysR family transcriptional regulator [Paucibacter sp. M5-1]
MFQFNRSEISMIGQVQPTGLERASRATLVQLRSFEAVVRLGGVGHAARALHLAQPTVSTQLKELAASLGLALFEPQGRRLVPTAVGERLALAVREMGAAWRGFEDDAAALQGLRRGSLRIAAVTTTEYFLPDLLGPFARQYPGIQIELAVENRDAVVARLERGDDELAAMMFPPQHLPLARWPFLENPLVIIAPTEHALTHRRRLRLSDLTGEPLLVREAGSGTRAAAEQAFAARGVYWLPRMALGSNEAIKHAVRAGLGLAVLSRHTLSQDPARDGLAVLPVAGFPLRRQWHLVWRQDRVLSLPARTLLDDLRARLHVRARPRA